MPKICAIVGWLIDARTCASRWNRGSRSASPTVAGRRTLRATSRFSRASRARKTSPMPPDPIGATTS
jgi:hypothetical protein